MKGDFIIFILLLLEENAILPMTARVDCDVQMKPVHTPIKTACDADKANFHADEASPHADEANSANSAFSWSLHFLCYFE